MGSLVKQEQRELKGTQRAVTQPQGLAPFTEVEGGLGTPPTHPPSQSGATAKLSYSFFPALSLLSFHSQWVLADCQLYTK